MTTVAPPTPTGVLAGQISRAVVQLYREYTGRGPTQAHTTITDDLVVVMMGDTLLKAEKSLAVDGKSELVLTMRRAVQDTMRADLTDAVERLSGRKVVAFMSHNHIEPDLASELFVLAPRIRVAPVATDDPAAVV
jgi:uncharacterized protein YbcI